MEGAGESLDGGKHRRSLQLRLLLFGLVVVGNALQYGDWLWREALPVWRLRAVVSELRRSAVEAGWTPSIVRAIAIEESKGRSRARSSAGAIGLLQLRLTTAVEMAELLGLPAPEAEEDLYDPTLNLRLGCEYLRQLRRRFDGDLRLVLAAYNAGPTRVSRWRRESPELASAVLIQRFAPRETRAFVDRVMRRAWRLRHLGGLPAADPPEWRSPPARLERRSD